MHKHFLVLVADLERIVSAFAEGALNICARERVARWGRGGGYFWINPVCTCVYSWISYIHMCTCVYIYIYIHIHVCTNIYTCIYMYVYVRICMFVRVCVCVYIYIHVCIRMQYIYIYMYICDNVTVSLYSNG